MQELMQANFARGPALLGPINEQDTRLKLIADAHELHAFAPVDTQQGRQSYQANLLAPLRAALPHGEERIDIRLAGRYAPSNHVAGDWVASSGHIGGVFDNDLFDIPATGQTVFVRFGRFERYVEGQIVETIILLDLPSLMMQAGVWPLAPSMGPWSIAPGPRAHDGIVARDVGGGEQSLALVEAMIGGLHKFKGQNPKSSNQQSPDLKAMGMRNFWSEHFWWYGPAPIGNFRGHSDYERGHQGPFLSAFPDRQGGNHRSRIGEGNYVASTGWPSITATHTGGGWLGLAPTTRKITMRVMDFWRREEALLDENWVMIDLIDLLGQMDLDVFARLRARDTHHHLSTTHSGD